MNDYFKTIQDRLNKYDRTYRHHPEKAAIKLIWWNIQWLFSGNRKTKPLEGNTFRIAVKFNGGVGDVLIQHTYIKALVTYLDQENIIVDGFAFKDQETAEAVFLNANYIHTVYPMKALKEKQKHYDLILNIQRFVTIFHIDRVRVKKFSERLEAYCKQIEAFSDANSYILNNDPRTDVLSTILSELNDKNRANQTDITHILGLSKEPVPFMDLHDTGFAILSKLGLQNKKYITFQRGIDHHTAIQENVRNWPITHYEGLIRLIKQRYPDVLLVQMGFSEELCEKFEGVDIDLRGKTNFEELKVLLKYATLHVDSEGGYAHIRHFLNTQSVVIFGPTPFEFYRYSDNINIKNNACPSPCEWVSVDWLHQCTRGFEQPPCMYETKPEDVFPPLSEFIEQQTNDCYRLEGMFTEAALMTECATKSGEKTAFIHYDDMVQLAEKIGGHSTHFFGLNTQRKKEIEYSGIYNISAKANSFDRVIAQINEDVAYPGYALMDCLRVLKPGGTLFLKCKAYSEQALSPLAIDLSAIALMEHGFYRLSKQSA